MKPTEGQWVEGHMLKQQHRPPVLGLALIREDRLSVGNHVKWKMILRGFKLNHYPINQSIQVCKMCFSPNNIFLVISRFLAVIYIELK